MNSDTFGIGIHGTGIMGRRMLAALQQHPRFRAVAAWDPDTRALQSALGQAQTQAKTAQSTATARAMARICNDERASFGGMSGHDRKTLSLSGLPFAVNFPFARGTASRRMREIVRGGDLGPIESATVRLRFARWPRDWQAGASAWLAGPAEGGFTREVLSHFAFQSLRLFGPAAVADVELQRAPGQAETALCARWIHPDVQVLVDAAVAGESADGNRFEVLGERGRVALTAWSRLEYQGHTSERVDNTAQTLDGLAALLEGQAAHGLATIDEATAVVRCVESMLRP